MVATWANPLEMLFSDFRLEGNDHLGHVQTIYLDLGMGIAKVALLSVPSCLDFLLHSEKP